MSNFLSDEEFLEHYGVKGMKWGVRRDGGSRANSGRTEGVRRVRANKARDQAASKRRVSEGKGKFGDNVSAAVTTSSAQVQKHGGYRNAQAAKAKNLDAYADRLETGKATTIDILRAYGSVSSADIAKYNR